MGPVLHVLPSKITRGILPSLFFPSVQPLLAVGGYEYELTRLGGQRQLPTDPCQARCGKNKNPCISSHEITCDASALRAAKGQRGVNRGVSTVWKVEGGQSCSAMRTVCVTLCLITLKITAELESESFLFITRYGCANIITSDFFFSPRHLHHEGFTQPTNQK